MENTFEKIESSSESESSSSEEEEINYEKQTYFMDMTSPGKYEENRNKLFTPEVSKIRILIDSKNITHTSNHDTSNYTVLLDDGDTTTNNTAGFQNYTNVIGFKLIKAIILNTIYQVTSNNNTINFNYGGSNKVSTLTPGAYTLDELSDQIKTQMNDSVSGTPFTVTVDDVTTYKYRIQSSASTFYFLKSSAWRLLGILNMDEEASAATGDKTLPNVVDHSIHYIDLVIPEIPYIACKHNMGSKSIIERIPLNVDAGSIISYTPEQNNSDNYFYPINLSKLTIQLYEDTNNSFYDCQNADNSFEFELTILNKI